jgi:hypothetical protein
MTVDAVFDHFNIPQDSDIRTSRQVAATYLFFRKTPHSIALVRARMLSWISVFD